MKKSRKLLAVTVVIALLFFSMSAMAINTSSSLKLKSGNFQIIVSQQEVAPVQLAVETLCKDFEKVMYYKPQVVYNADNAKGIDIIIMNDALSDLTFDSYFIRPLDGFESYRIYSDPEKSRVYIHGKDMRGTIYAIYTFSEKFLSVPPLWYFSSWIPEYKKQIEIPSDFDFFQRSPQVRYRAWFPNDADLFNPWRKLSKENNELWLETMLRLKLNTVELGATVTYPDHTLSKQVELLHKYGLILTSHHHIALNNSFTNWNGYWREVRKMEPPVFSLSREQDLIDFWTYSVETIDRSGIENLWQITFRGAGDQPFWALFSDAPKGEKERAEVINRMLYIQLDLIKRITGNKEPDVRITFYDELSDLLTMGYLMPPVNENMLWTFVAARRDHYPNEDLVAFDTARHVKLGYYMNLQFTSTGSHLAPGEGPWKMEANYRYANSRAPLSFSVLNVGNIREFVLSMSANAKMMWDIASYNTNTFLEEFCKQYFGNKHAADVAKLYHNYFYSYWQQKGSDFPGIERQFIFHDLRYSKVFDQITARFHNFSPNPLKDIGFECMPGRTFRIEGANQVDSLLVGMKKTAPRFAAVAVNCEEVMKQLPVNNRKFFRDNLYAPCCYMENLSFSMYHFLYAYKIQSDFNICYENLELAIKYLEKARDALYATQEGVFKEWYEGDRVAGKFNIPQKLSNMYRIREAMKQH